MNIKALSFAISSAIALICAGSSDAVGSPPGHAGPPGGGGPPGLSDPPGNSDFGLSQGGGPPDWPDSIDYPLGFECEYNVDGVIAGWINDSDGVCGPLYGGDLTFDVDYMLLCTGGNPIPAGMHRVEFDLDTDPEAVWNFSCGPVDQPCNATGAWTDIDLAIDEEMGVFFDELCVANGGWPPVEGEFTWWEHSEEFTDPWTEYDGIYADIKGLCPGKLRRSNNPKFGDACGSAI